METEEPNEKGNVLSDNSTAIDCRNVLLRAEDKSQELVGLGIENIIAIAMKDAVLGIKKSVPRGEESGINSEEKEVKQAEYFPVDHRPWGWFEIVTEAPTFKVKKYLLIQKCTSLQSHKFRSEHWVVVVYCKVTINDKVELLKSAIYLHSCESGSPT